MEPCRMSELFAYPVLRLDTKESLCHLHSLRLQLGDPMKSHPMAPLLPGLSLLIGAQCIRVLLPSIAWYLRETLGVDDVRMTAFACTPFVLALAAPLLHRLFKSPGALLLSGGGLLVSRLTEQISSSPWVDLWASLGGTTCFLWLLPLLHTRARARGTHGIRGFTSGLLIGLSLDTTLRGLTHTLDLSWLQAPEVLVIVIGIVSTFGYMLWREIQHEESPGDTGFLDSIPLIGMGPFLFIQLHILQNQGWVSELTGLPHWAALILITLGNLGAITTATLVMARIRASSRWWTPLLGGLLMIVLTLIKQPGHLFTITVLGSLVTSGALLALIVSHNNSQHPHHAGTFGTSLALGLGMLLFVTLIQAYYLSMVIHIPIAQASIAPLAAVIVTLCSLGGECLSHSYNEEYSNPDWRPVRISAFLLLISLVIMVSDTLGAKTPKAGHGYPIRMMTYNIHSAYGTNGRQDVEAIAQVIEQSGADVVALQEVSRGWMLNGSTDLLTLLSRKLNMPYTVMGATADPIWGNAILSHYPIIQTGQGAVPRLDTLIGRGYLWALLDLGAGERVLLIATHLHHEEHRSEVHIPQVKTVLREWDERPQTVLLGDMNTIPGRPEIHLILQAGFVDSWQEEGIGLGYTFPSYSPDRRIDWLFHTTDLVARDVTVTQSQASDHFAVAATIAKAP